MNINTDELLKELYDKFPDKVPDQVDNMRDLGRKVGEQTVMKFIEIIIERKQHEAKQKAKKS